MNSLNIHETYMFRALQLAKKGQGRVSPNPMVGCVIVKNGKIIGEGYHRQFGKDHAEVEAFKRNERKEGDCIYMQAKADSMTSLISYSLLFTLR